MPAKIFVNYRRSNAREPAFLIAARLKDRYGADSVFIDENLSGGEVFPDVLKRRLAQCCVLLVVMGPGWLETKDDDGSRRLDNPTDWVREEIRQALNLGIPVLPVLINGATVPPRSELPGDIASLVDHHALPVRTDDHAFKGHMLLLMQDIDRIRSRRLMPRRAMVAVAAALLAIGGGWHAGYSSALPGLPRPPWLTPPAGLDPSELGSSTSAAAVTKRVAELRSENERRDALELKRKAEQEAQAKAAAVAEGKRKAEEAARRDPALTVKPGSGKSFRDCNDVCPEMVVVPAGSFMMGSSPSEIAALTQEIPNAKELWQSEGPQRSVTIGQRFAMGKYEVTFAEWDACVEAGGCTRKPSDEGWGRGRRPVINVRWHDITDQYLPWLNRHLGLSGSSAYRLPTEAEWEYAARAGTRTRYAVGDSISRNQAQFSDNLLTRIGAKPVEVGSFPPNLWGLHDMHGNVAEWVEDCFADSYANAPVDGSAYTSSSCVTRLLRGGSWAGSNQTIRSGSRISERRFDSYWQHGFRVARTLLTP